MAAPEKHLLIARINGKSSSRRQRAFKDAPTTLKAIERWEAEGFNTFWVYGPVATRSSLRVRPELAHWNRGDAPEKVAQIKAELKGAPA